MAGTFLSLAGFSGIAPTLQTWAIIPKVGAFSFVLDNPSLMPAIFASSALCCIFVEFLLILALHRSERSKPRGNGRVEPMSIRGSSNRVASGHIIEVGPGATVNYHAMPAVLAFVGLLPLSLAVVVVTGRTFAKQQNAQSNVAAMPSSVAVLDNSSRVATRDFVEIHAGASNYQNIGTADAATLKKIIDHYDHELAEQAEQLAAKEHRIAILESALQRVQTQANAGDADAHAAIEEARRTGDANRLQQVLMRVADGMTERAAGYVAVCREVAEIAYLRGDINEAERRLHAIFELEPNDRDAINQTARIHLLRGRVTSAIEAFQRILCLSQGDPVGQAVAYGNLGIMLRMRGDVSDAEAMIRKSLEIFEKLGHDEATANGYSNLGDILLIQGDLGRAEAMYRRAQEIYVNTGDSRGEARQYCSLGHLYSLRAELDHAEAMFLEALEIDQELQYSEGVAGDYGNLAQVYIDRGDLDQAEALSRRALAINEKIGVRAGIAGNYLDLGNVHRLRGEFVQAETMYQMVLDIQSELEDAEKLAITYSSLGNLYRARGELDQSDAMFRRALEISSSLGSPQIIADLYSGQANVHLVRGELDKAEVMYGRALEINERMGRLVCIANDYANLGLVHWARGDCPTARKFWTKARGLYSKIGIDNSLIRVQNMIHALDANELSKVNGRP